MKFPGTIVKRDRVPSAQTQTQLILTACQIRYHSHCGIIIALDSSAP